VQIGVLPASVFWFDNRVRLHGGNQARLCRNDNPETREVDAAFRRLGWRGKYVHAGRGGGYFCRLFLAIGAGLAYFEGENSVAWPLLMP